MKIAFLILLFAALVWPATGRPETVSLARIEVIVFQHSNGQSDRWPAPLTDDYSALVDPRSRASQTGGIAGQTWIQSPDQRRQSTPNDADQGVSWPPRYVDLNERSAVIQRALERLEENGNYRVLTQLSWIQPLERGVASQPVRVRGDEQLQHLSHSSTPPVQTISPWRPSGQINPETTYRLDGSLTLRQQQFRHVDLDLVWRELPPILPNAGPLAPSNYTPPDVLIHRLKLSRPIGLDRLEYFDSSWLGVLVFVQEWTGAESENAAGHPTAGS